MMEAFLLLALLANLSALLAPLLAQPAGGNVTGGDQKMLSLQFPCLRNL